MKKPIRIVLKVLVVLAAIVLGFFLLFYALFGWEGVRFGTRVNDVKEHYDSLTSEEYDKIIAASQEAIGLWKSSEDKFIITFREAPLGELEASIPPSLEYLKPRRVDISDDYVDINFLFMMDSSASIIVRKTVEGDWAIFGDYEEWEPPYEIYRKEGRGEL
tara:strand:- start:1213 stop:1695 length:483 start_codon:yes stop_codon:yes gene_type:complete